MDGSLEGFSEGVCVLDNGFKLRRLYAETYWETGMSKPSVKKGLAAYNSGSRRLGNLVGF